MKRREKNADEEEGPHRCSSKKEEVATTQEKAVGVVDVDAEEAPLVMTKEGMKPIDEAVCLPAAATSGRKVKQVTKDDTDTTKLCSLK